MERHEGGYYIRLMARDLAGTAATIATRLAEQKISIESIVQRHPDGAVDLEARRGSRPSPVPVILITYATTEDAVRRALQAVVPGIGLVAVHILQKTRMVGMLKHGLNFGAQGHGILHTPLRKHAGMHHEKVLTQRIGVQASQRLLAQPVQQGGAVRCLQYLVKGIALALAA